MVLVSIFPLYFSLFLSLSLAHCVVSPHRAAISCGDPGSPPYATLLGKRFTNGAVVHYSCGQGRILIGNSSRYCQEDGRWSGSTPYCSGTPFPPPPERAPAVHMTRFTPQRPLGQLLAHHDRLLPSCEGSQEANLKEMNHVVAF